MFKSGTSVVRLAVQVSPSCRFEQFTPPACGSSGRPWINPVQKARDVVVVDETEFVKLVDVEIDLDI